jgi:hypothetical protein
LKKFALGWKSTALEKTNQEEIPGDRENHVLQRDREPGGDEPGEGRERAQLGDQREEDEERDREGHHDAPQEQELVAPVQVLHVAEGRAPPELGGGEDEPDRDREQPYAEQQAAQFAVILNVDRGEPVVEVGLEGIEEQPLAGERNQCRRDLAEVSGQVFDGLGAIAEDSGIGRVRLCGDLIAPLQRRL